MKWHKTLINSRLWFYYQKGTSLLCGTSRVLKAALAGKFYSCFDIYLNPTTPLHNFYFWIKSRNLRKSAFNLLHSMHFWFWALILPSLKTLLNRTQFKKVILTSPLPIQILSVLHDSTFNYVWPYLFLRIFLLPPYVCGIHVLHLYWTLLYCILLFVPKLHFTPVFSMRLISLRKLVSNLSCDKLGWKSYHRKPNLSILFLTYWPLQV